VLRREASGNGDNLNHEVCWIWYNWQISFAKSSWEDDEGRWIGCGATRAVIAHDVTFPAIWFDVCPPSSHGHALVGLFSSVMNLSDTSQPKAEGHSDRCMPTLDAVNVGRKVAADSSDIQAYASIRSIHVRCSDFDQDVVMNAIQTTNQPP